MKNTLEEYRKRYSVIEHNRYNWIRMNAPQDKKIVDIGSCYGFVFCDYDRRLVTSVDLDDYSHIIDNFVQADAKSLPFPDKSFDIAVLGEILEHQNKTRDVEDIIREACRVSREFVIITVPNEYLWADNTDKFKPYLEIRKEEGFDVTKKAQETAKAARALHSADDYDHIHHHQHFSPYDFERIIPRVTDRDFYIFILPNDGDVSKGMHGTTGVLIT